MLKELIKKIFPDFLLSWYHLLLALIGAIIYRFPSCQTMVIGITGTNGKSTTVEMAAKILEEAGYKVACLSSIKFKYGEKEFPNSLRMTMPGRLTVQKFLRQAVNSHCQYAVLEVTSEGIKQHRHRFIKFKTAVLTNLTPEHIEAHGGFENYRRAKTELFQLTKGIQIVNLDDENAAYFLDFSARQKWGYGVNLSALDGEIFSEAKHLKFADKNWKVVSATDVKTSPLETSFVVNNLPFSLKLGGGFNVYNALAAIAVGLSEGVELKTCQAGLKKINGLPGRLEEVIAEPFRVFVDYAFTPNALDKVYATLRQNFGQVLPSAENKEPKMICVLGACGGGRDKWKRPVLGAIAAKYCDRIIITNEDPYDEDPVQILSMIKAGMVDAGYPAANFYEILDRREAIKKALNLATPADTVIITGKGCEPSICLAGGKQIPWDDRQTVREEATAILRPA